MSGFFGGDAAGELGIDESAAIDDFNQNGGSLSGGALDNYVVARSRIMLSFMVTTLSLAAAPWLAFWLGGVIVHMMVATGYDQAGHVHHSSRRTRSRRSGTRRTGSRASAPL